jgi:hypothetical protein
MAASLLDLLRHTWCVLAEAADESNNQHNHMLYWVDQSKYQRMLMLFCSCDQDLSPGLIRDIIVRRLFTNV